MRTLQCTVCGSPAVAGRLFCDQCGNPLPAGSATVVPSPLSPGTAVGTYTILAPLECSSGHRYAARDSRGLPVWIKEGVPARLDAEAAALSVVAHPAVSPVVERFHEGERDFLVITAPVAAVALEQAGSLDAEHAVAVALQLCDLAEAWHQAGYVYGDFAPGSVYYQAATGRVFLPGAAAAVRIGSGEPGDPMAEGAAPEVVAGASPGPAADVYGVASTIYRVLARRARGTLPLGRTGQLLPPLQSTRPDLPPDFCSALGQALSVHAAERFQTPAALLAALREVSAPVRLETGACTDRGSVRPNNQDCLFSAVLGLAGGDRQRTAGGIFLCCDGMGGEAGGEIASGIAAEAVGGALSAFLGTRLAKSPPPDGAELEAALQGAVNRANRLIRDRVRASPALLGMGTTITAAAVAGSLAAIIQVGDSRAYLWEPGGAIRQLTRDQSVVGQMVAAGKITEQEARLRPDRALLWQAVGSRDSLEPEVIHLNLQSGQRLLLVSDGVHGFITESELSELLARPLPAAAAANLVVNTAIAHGSDDNCSALLVSVHGRVS